MGLDLPFFPPLLIIIKIIQISFGKAFFTLMLPLKGYSSVRLESMLLYLCGRFLFFVPPSPSVVLKAARSGKLSYLDFDFKLSTLSFQFKMKLDFRVGGGGEGATFILKTGAYSEYILRVQCTFSGTK